MTFSSDCSSQSSCNLWLCCTCICLKTLAVRVSVISKSSLWVISICCSPWSQSLNRGYSSLPLLVGLILKKLSVCLFVCWFVGVLFVFYKTLISAILKTLHVWKCLSVIFIFEKNLINGINFFKHTFISLRIFKNSLTLFQQAMLLCNILRPEWFIKRTGNFFCLLRLMLFPYP